MKYLIGDLIELAKARKFDGIIHGANCFHTMGAGIAKQIKKEFPEAYEADLMSEKGSKEKLGMHSYQYYVNRNFFVINAYTQFHPGPNVDYDAIRNVAKQFTNPRMHFGIPKIGCGIAGGDWLAVEKIFDEECECDITCVIWPGDLEAHLDYCARCAKLVPLTQDFRMGGMAPKLQWRYPDDDCSCMAFTEYNDERWMHVRGNPSEDSIKEWLSPKKWIETFE